MADAAQLERPRVHTLWGTGDCWAAIDFAWVNPKDLKYRITSQGIPSRYLQGRCLSRWAACSILSVSGVGVPSSHEPPTR
jgi:hypothetical protein